MKNYLVIFKLCLFTIINVWLLYLISTKLELDKLCIESAWLDYLINLISSNLGLEIGMNPTIELKLFVLLCVFVIFSIMFLYIISKFNKLKIGMSVLLVFMIKTLYKVQNNFLTLGEDINILGITMEHIMSIKEKSTLLKDYIKNNNIIIDNQDFIIIWDAIKPLKKLDEVKETIEQLVEALKGKELSTIEYMYSLLTVQNIMIVGVTCGVVYFGWKLFGKINNLLNNSVQNDSLVNIDNKLKTLNDDQQLIKNENLLNRRGIIKNKEDIDLIKEDFKQKWLKIDEKNESMHRLITKVLNVQTQFVTNLEKHESIINKLKIIV